MTRRSPNYVLGYHGCERATALSILKDGKPFKASQKNYDWLGPGVYFWENDPFRALEWAYERTKTSRAEGAYVLGAIIDLGNCLDLTLRENMKYLKLGYESLLQDHRASSDIPLPKNQDPVGAPGGDKLLRFLDCAVIRRVHTLVDLIKSPPFDTVRGLFPEGDPVYPDARFMEKTHTQIAVINPDCIIEVFTPRQLVTEHGMSLNAVV